MLKALSKKFLYLIFTFNFTNNSTIINEKISSKIPKEIYLEFQKDENIFLKDTINIFLYRSFYTLIFITIAINIIGLYAIEKNSFYKDNYLNSKYVLPLIFISQLLFNIIAPLKLNFFKFKITWFIINNFINFTHIFYLWNLRKLNLEYQNLYFANTIIYLIISNVIIATASLDNKLKLDVNKLIKELDMDDNLNNNLFI